MSSLPTNIKIEPGTVKLEVNVDFSRDVDTTPLLPEIRIKSEPMSPGNVEIKAEVKPEPLVPNPFISGPRKRKWNGNNRNRFREGNPAKYRFVSGPGPNNRTGRAPWQMCDLTLPPIYKIGVWDRNFMSKSALETLKRAIVLEMMNSYDDIPKICDCIEQQGWLQISCLDKENTQWIHRTIPRLKPWPYAQLVTRECRSYNKWLVPLSADYHNAKNVNELMLLLKRQNKELDTNWWRISNAVYYDNYFTVEFILTEEQVDELRRVSYRPTVGFGKAVVNMNFLKCIKNFNRGSCYPNGEYYY